MHIQLCILLSNFTQNSLCLNYQQIQVFIYLLFEWITEKIKYNFWL